jgi:glycosyltransferase involved in cell wall biosynthesis
LPNDAVCVNLALTPVSYILCWRDGGETWSDGPGNLDHGAGFVAHALEAGGAFRFEIEARHPALDRLLLRIATFSRRNSGNLICTLADASGAQLAATTTQLDTLDDYQFHCVLNLAGAPVKAGSLYTVTLLLEAAPGNEIAIYLAEADFPTGLSARRRGEPDQPGGGARPAIDAALRDKLLRNDAKHQSISLVPGDTVVVCTHALPPGGAERQWIYLASGLKKLGYRPIFVLLLDLEDPNAGRNAHYLPMLQAEQIPIAYVPRQPAATLHRMLSEDAVFAEIFKENLLPDALALARLTLIFRQLSPKTVFAQLDWPNLYAGFAALLAGVPRIVVSFRSYNPTNFPLIYQAWLHRAYVLLAQSRRVLFCGNAAAANRDYEAWIGLDPGRAITIANAVSPRHFPPPSVQDVATCRRDLGLVPGAPTVIGVFRLVPTKGPFVFLDVCASLAKTLAGLRVIVAGVGHLQPELEARAGELGLEGIVKFLGRRSDLNVLMASADLLLLTSEKEGMPNVLLEAQLQGLPAVATDTGAVNSAILPDITGLLCPVNDVAALTQACTTLLHNPALRRRMGEAGARHARGSFGIDRMSRAYLQLARTHASRGGLSARRLLLGTDEPEPGEEAAFFANIRNGNGVWKTTYAHRMDDLNNVFAALHPGPSRLRIMDVGASSGISTVEWRDDLLARRYRPRMVATDLMIYAFLIRAGAGHYILTDNDGRVLQTEIDGYIAFPKEIERRPTRSEGVLKAAWRRIVTGERSRIRVKLITRRARSIRFLEDDFFAPNRASFRGRFDVLRAANLLNLKYFPETKLREGVINLRQRLTGEGAMFIVNRTLHDGTNHGSIFRLDRLAKFQLLGRTGNGSEIEAIVLEV